MRFNFRISMLIGAIFGLCILASAAYADGLSVAMKYYEPEKKDPAFIYPTFALRYAVEFRDKDGKTIAAPKSLETDVKKSFTEQLQDVEKLFAKAADDQSSTLAKTRKFSGMVKWDAELRNRIKQVGDDCQSAFDKTYNAWLKSSAAKKEANYAAISASKKIVTATLESTLVKEELTKNHEIVYKPLKTNLFVIPTQPGKNGLNTPLGQEKVKKIKAALDSDNLPLFGISGSKYEPRSYSFWNPAEGTYCFQ